MKKWKQAVLLAVMALVFGMAAGADAQAAKITGVKQTDATRSSVNVECEVALGTPYYVLQASTDKKSWVNMDWSSSPNNLCASQLAAGSTYWVRVIGASNYTGDAWCTDASDAVEVVTVPNDDNAKLVQIDAKANKITMQFTGVSTGASGANWYVLGNNSTWKDNVAMGTSTTSTVSTKTNLKAGTKYYIYGYACRRAASTGFVAHPSWDSAYDSSAMTLPNKINTNSFKCTNAWTNLNSYQFAVSSGIVADGFHYQFQTVKGKVKKNQYRENGWSNYITVDNFINGTFYRYRVRPYVDCGTKKVYGAWSGFRYIGVSKAVSGNWTSNGNGKKIRLSWKKVSGAAKYVVYISKSENGGFKKVKTLSSKKSSITITKMGKKKLKRNTRYYIKVVAMAKKGKKTVSSEVNRTVYTL